MIPHHREQYPEDFANTLDVILWQIDKKGVPFELQKFPDIPGGYGAIYGRQASSCPRIEALCGHHGSTTLAHASLEIFIFGFDDYDNWCVNEELFPRLRNEKITHPVSPVASTGKSAPENKLICRRASLRTSTSTGAIISSERAFSVDRASAKGTFSSKMAHRKSLVQLQERLRRGCVVLQGRVETAGQLLAE